MLNLENVNINIEDLAAKYRLCCNNNHYLFDGDMEELFSNSNIEVGQTLYKAKDWKYDEDGWLIGCEDGDYLETIELIQKGKIYLCQAFSDFCGDGLEYMLALNNVSALYNWDLNGCYIMKEYRGYNLNFYPQCDRCPAHDNRYQTVKARPYDDAEYFWAYSYDKQHWRIVYKGKFVNENFVGTFEDVVDVIEERNEKIKAKMVHW